MSNSSNGKLDPSKAGSAKPEVQTQRQIAELHWGWLLQGPPVTDCSLQALKQAAMPLAILS